MTEPATDLSGLLCQYIAWANWQVMVSRELERRWKLYQKINRSLKLQRLFYQKCHRDFFFWAENFLWVFDSRNKPFHFPVIPFVKQREYIRTLLDEDGENLLIEKSRDAGGSIWLCAVALWRWLFRPGSDFGLITRVGKDLDDGTFNSLFGKLDYMISNLPKWMLPRAYYLRRSHPSPLLSNLHNGNKIVGGATTTNTFRGGRFRFVAIDEAAHIPDLAEILRAASGVTERIIILSSVNGQNNDFAHIRHGRYGWQSAPLGLAGQDEGVWRWMSLHYKDDPRKTPAWVLRKKNSVLPETWAAEYEISYAGSTRWRVVAEYDPQLHLFGAEKWQGFYHRLLQHAQVVEAWDFGQGASLTTCTWFAYISAIDVLYAIDYRSWRETPYDTVAYDVGAAGWYTARTPQGFKPQARIGDVYGKSRDANQESWMTYLASAGIVLKGVSARNFTANNHLIRQKIRDGKLFLGPNCAVRHNPSLPSFSESLQGYTYKIQGSGDTAYGSEPDKHSIHSHAYDTLVYAALHIWDHDSIKVIETEVLSPHAFVQTSHKPPRSLP